MINFGAGHLICTPLTDATGVPVATPQPVRLGTLQDVSVDLGADIKTLYGQGDYPIAAGRGKANSSIKAKMAEISGAILGSLYYGRTGTSTIKAPVIDHPATLAATVTVVPPQSGTFVADLGVINVTQGVPMKRVNGAPAAGQYSVSAGGDYTFHADDVGDSGLFSYEYSANGTVANAATTFDLRSQPMGYMPTFSVILVNQYAGDTLVLKLNRCVSGKLSIPLKNDDFAVGDFEMTAFADAAGSIGYLSLFKPT